jgi:hypothetical protein
MTGNGDPTTTVSGPPPDKDNLQFHGGARGDAQRRDSREHDGGAPRRSVSAGQEKQRRPSTEGSIRRRREYEEDDRTATELPELPEGSHHDAGDDEEWMRDERRYSDVTTAADSADMRRYRLCRQTPHWYDGMLKFWQREVSVKVDAGTRRDHLGNLPAFPIAPLGVREALLTRLQRSNAPSWATCAPRSPSP